MWIYLKQDLTSGVMYDEFQHIKKKIKSGMKEAVIKLYLINPITRKREWTYKLCSIKYKKNTAIVECRELI